MIIKEKFVLKLDGKDLVVELGTMAHLAEQALTITYGNTVVLTTVTYRETNTYQDFFPLQVIFQEKLYSVGKIPGGFLKREGRPSEYATLCARLIDRSVRPLFPAGFVNEVQVVNSVFAVDENCDVRVSAALGTSLALSLSCLPFQGPTATVIVGQIANKFVLNPSQEQLQQSPLELIVGGTKTSINMVEAGCHDISEEVMTAALKFAHEAIVTIITFQEKIISKIKPPKLTPNLLLVPRAISAFVSKHCYDDINKLAVNGDKKARNAILATLLTTTCTSFYLDENLKAQFPDGEMVQFFIKCALDELLKTAMRTLILTHNKRPDGRKVADIRPLSSMIDVLPRDIVHGSAIFARGETQVMSVLTLGALTEHQIIDGLGVEEYKRFMHHYNFPPFSVGETGRMGVPSRREIGHGALGEKALLQIIPDETIFPYTIRLVSEVLASNGSTSQAAICASSLALMAGGVPVRAPIAGIAMGLIKEQDQFVILTDIQGLEDHLGDMDFKVAGTKDGICALQMDIKIAGIDLAIISQALAQAQIARLKVLKNMNSIIKAPRSELAATAPKIMQKMVAVDKIRDIIGTGGKVINKIISECDNVKIDIEDNGRLLLYHQKQAVIDQAWALIDKIINPVPITVGSEFNGKIVKIMPFGAFVNLQDKVDGLVHISQFAKKLNHHISDLNKEVKIDDAIKVRVMKVEENGKISLEIIA